MALGFFVQKKDGGRAMHERVMQIKAQNRAFKCVLNYDPITRIKVIRQVRKIQKEMERYLEVNGMISLKHIESLGLQDLANDAMSEREEEHHITLTLISLWLNSLYFKDESVVNNFENLFHQLKNSVFEFDSNSILTINIMNVFVERVEVVNVNRLE